MIPDNKQFIKDMQGKNIGVFMPIEQYEEIIGLLEELDDIKAFDKAKTENEETIPLREAIRHRKQKNG